MHIHRQTNERTDRQTNTHTHTHAHTHTHTSNPLYFYHNPNKHAHAHAHTHANAEVFLEIEVSAENSVDSKALTKDHFVTTGNPVSHSLIQGYQLNIG